jgi:hypothetical protein
MDGQRIKRYSFGSKKMKYHGPKDRLLAAQAEDTEPAELRQLSRSEYCFVREAVATNPNTPIDTLETLTPANLTSDDDFKTALGLLKNPKLPPQIAGVIADRVVLSVGRINPREFHPTRLIDALVRCTRVPAESLLPLSDTNTIPKHIRGRIAEPGVRPELLTRLMQDPSENIRARARRAMETKPNQAVHAIGAAAPQHDG